MNAELLPENTNIYIETPPAVDLIINWVEVGHLALDVAGIIDPTGIADLINSIWYSFEVRRDHAVLSFLCALPGIGYQVGLLRLAGRGGIEAGEKLAGALAKNADHAKDLAGREATGAANRLSHGKNGDLPTTGKPIGTRIAASESSGLPHREYDLSGLTSRQRRIHAQLPVEGAIAVFRKKDVFNERFASNWKGHQR